MYEINLLPWREEKQKRLQQGRWLSWIGGIAIGVGSWVGLHEGLLMTNQKIQHEITPLVKRLQADKPRLWERKKIFHQEKWIESMAHQQKKSWDQWRQLLRVTVLPIEWQEMVFTKTAVFLTGRVHTIKTLRQLVNCLRQATAFSSVRVKEIAYLTASDVWRFEVVVYG